jgi:hypothetical protein
MSGHLDTPRGRFLVTLGLVVATIVVGWMTQGRMKAALIAVALTAFASHTFAFVIILAVATGLVPLSKTNARERAIALVVVGVAITLHFVQPFPLVSIVIISAVVAVLAVGPYALRGRTDGSRRR